MARNQEKAQAMLNRLLTSKQQEAKGPREKRPYLATECHDVNEADRWRQQILREIGRKVMEIQNAGLGEHRCALRGTGWHADSIAARLLLFCLSGQVWKEIPAASTAPLRPLHLLKAHCHLKTDCAQPVLSMRCALAQDTRPERRNKQADTGEGALGSAYRRAGRA